MKWRADKASERTAQEKFPLWSGMPYAEGLLGRAGQILIAPTIERDGVAARVLPHESRWIDIDQIIKG